MLDPVGMPRISQDQPDARIQERQLAKAMLEPFEVELDDLEGLGTRQEGDAGTLLALGLAHDLERRLGIAMAEAHEMFFAIAPDGEVEPFAERVDHRHADPV